MSSQKRKEEEKRKETGKKKKRKGESMLKTHIAYTYYKFVVYVCVCIYVYVTFEMAESDSETAVNYVWHLFSHSRLICTVWPSPRIVHLCVRTYARAHVTRQKDCTDVCSDVLFVHTCMITYCVCVPCSGKKFIH